MSFRIERPLCLAQPRAACCPDDSAGGQPSATRAEKTRREKCSWKHSNRHSRSEKEEGPAASLAAEFSHLISLNQNIVYVMGLATFNSPVRKGNPELLNPLPEGVAGRASVPPCAGEIRRPKAEIRKKSEGRNPRQTARSRSPLHTFGLRLSGFFRISAFGFRIWRLLHVAASVVFLVQQLVNNAAAADAQSSAREAFERATFDLADAVPTNSERASVAEQGIAVSKQALQRASNSAPVHYYLGLNLAQLARTKTFGALSIVNKMEAEFTR